MKEKEIRDFINAVGTIATSSTLLALSACLGTVWK